MILFREDNSLLNFDHVVEVQASNDGAVTAKLVCGGDPVPVHKCEDYEEACAFISELSRTWPIEGSITVYALLERAEESGQA